MCKSFLLAFVLVLATAAQPIKIHVIDGRNGRSIPDERLQTWYDRASGPAVSLPTDFQGIATVDPAQAERLIISSNLYIDCRYSRASGAIRSSYSIREIRTNGIAAANTCNSTLRIQPKASQLLFLFDPSTGGKVCVDNIRPQGKPYGTISDLAY